MLADRKLRELVSEFTEGILEGRPSTDMCLIVCAPLSGYMRFLGYKCEVVEGWVGDLGHHWIALPDGTIIDPTADQFKRPDGTKMPAIYIGKKPEWYEVINPGKEG